MSSANLKSEIAPKGMKFNVNDFIISDKYATILTIISYPKTIQPGFLSNVTNIPGIKVVVKHIPIPFSSMQKMLNREIVDLKDRYQKERDRTLQERLRQDYESLEAFVQMLAATQSKIWDFQMHIMITADTKEELENKKMQVRNYLDSMGMRGIPMMFEQEKVLKSMLPIFPKQDIEDRVGIPIPAPTIAAMYPFVFDSIKDPGSSTLLGVDFSGGVVLFNQFLYQIKKEYNRNNANIIILGTSGSGKSTTAKLLLRTHIRNNCKIIAIDPEGELEEMAKIFNGDFIDLGKGGAFGLINPLEVIMDADEDEIKEGAGYSVLTRTLQSLKAFMKYYYPTIEDDVLQMFSEVCQETYKRFNIDFNSDFSSLNSDEYPTFDDVYSTIKGKLLSMPEATREKDVMERLELRVRPFIGELRYYFNGHTSLKADSNFIVFNIKELMNSDANIRNALFFNILKYAWSLCLDKSNNTVMYVDEAHILLGAGNELGAVLLVQVL